MSTPRPPRPDDLLAVHLGPAEIRKAQDIAINMFGEHLTKRLVDTVSQSIFDETKARLEPMIERLTKKLLTDGKLDRQFAAMGEEALVAQGKSYFEAIAEAMVTSEANRAELDKIVADAWAIAKPKLVELLAARIVGAVK